MVRLVGIFSALLGGLALLGLSLLVPGRSEGVAAATTREQAVTIAPDLTVLDSESAPTMPAEAATLPSPAPPPPPTPPPPTPLGTLRSGVLIVVSIPSQRAFVFRDGDLWGSSPVSTGRRGYETPVGEFTILQKKVRHRSTIYENAPMPYMQRLTWDGVAFHAGHVPGYPASHGCIRLPASFARKLYGVTDPASTAVLVSDRPTGSAVEAYSLASGEPVAPALAERMTASSPMSADGEGQTIQLAAAADPDNAARLWQQLLQRRPELRQLDHEIVAATVRSARVFRLRASGRDAHSICARLTSAGIACLKVSG